MSRRKKKLCVLFLSGLCCLALSGGCGTEEKSPSPNTDVVENTQPDSESPESQASSDDSEDASISPDDAEATYKPSDLTIPSQATYELSYMGLNVSPPQSLLDRMDNKEVAMLNDEGYTEDEMALSYALVSWKSITPEQRDMEVSSSGNGFYDWADTLSPIGAIGAYQQEEAKNLDSLTGCSEHIEIGKSEDGSYTYYLSVNPDADSALQEEINSISYEITDVVPLEELLSSEESDSSIGTGSLGEFSMEDINGEAYTQEMFADYDLTMVNIFTTWCTPCVNEIPDLQKLRDEMAGQGVNVVGIVLDSVDESGAPDPETIEKAKLLAERTGVSYPFLIPDTSMLNGRLTGIDAVPETFFVDKEGNIVGQTYSGSRSLEDWKTVVETELKGATQ